MTQAIAPQAVVPPNAPSNAALVYRGLRDQRSVLGDQVNELQRMRSNLVRQLNTETQTAATKSSLEKRIASVDERIADVDKQIAKSDQAVATAAAVPGATVRPPDPPRRGVPEEVFVLSGIFMVIVLLPLSVALARRIWRSSSKSQVSLTPELSQRMESMERGVEAIAIEVERIGEGQRYVTNSLRERGDVHALGAGGAEPIPVRQRPRERVDERR